MTSHRILSSPRKYAAFTLVELLVVIAVISVLAAIALPTVKNTLREQKVTRAASTVQAFIEEARARAILSGGGGLIIDRLGSGNLFERSQAMRLRLADIPPAYNGDSAGSKSVFGYYVDAGPPPQLYYTLWFDPLAAQIKRSQTDIASSIQPTLINPGDIVLLGNAGLQFRVLDFLAGSIARRDAAGISSTVITDAEAPSWVMMRVLTVEGNADYRRLRNQSFTYEIQRQPRPAISAPVTMPEGTVIDLTSSGMGREGNQFSPLEINVNYINEAAAPFLDEPATPPVPNPNDYQSIWVMFSGRGDVSAIYYPNLGPSPGFVPTLSEQPVIGDIHLLVGRAGELKVAPTGQLEDDDPVWDTDQAKDGTTPILDPESIWVTIKARTGEVIASPLSLPIIPARPATVTNANHQARVHNVIGQARNAAMESRDGGSL